MKKERKTKHIALLVHDANCPHCRQALPELEQVAVRLSKEPAPWLWGLKARFSLLLATWSCYIQALKP